MDEFEIQTIWTLDARDSVYLEVITEYFNHSDQMVRRHITESLDSLSDELTSRGLNYKSLKNALIPHRGDKLERAFLFDRAKISTPSYGGVIGEAVLSTIGRQQIYSVLDGDLWHSDQETAKRILYDELVSSDAAAIADTEQLYCVYLNNLTRSAARSIDDALSDVDFYFGYVDTTYSTPTKDWLSFVLSTSYVKVGTKFICGHEDDSAIGTNTNMPNWPLEESNYKCFSVPRTLFHLLMSYKIERQVTPGFESDSSFSVNAISDGARPVHEMEVVVEAAKREYLLGAKSGSMELAGVEQMTNEELALSLQSKLRSNYIYNLRYREATNTSLFNIVLEFPVSGRPKPVKLLAGMEYLSESNELKLVTLF
jgi:hypothetical protein